MVRRRRTGSGVGEGRRAVPRGRPGRGGYSGSHTGRRIYSCGRTVMDCFREGRRGGGLLFAMYGKCSRRTKHMQTNKPSALSHSAACVAWKGNDEWRSCCGVFFEWLRRAGVAQVACGPVWPASRPRRCNAAKGRFISRRLGDLQSSC